MRMKVREHTYVAIEYSLSLDSGEVVAKTREGESYGFIVGAGQVVPGLDEGLHGMEEGQSAQISVEASQGYGERRSEMCQKIQRSFFPEDADIRPGESFQTMGPQGPVGFEVTAVEGDMVVADFNHPLAGERLHFDVTVREVREPEPGEIEALLTGSGCSQTACGSCGGGCH
jgi:FKBP-type peptidyl-prolyl cis-trans isomerase SlyD